MRICSHHFDIGHRDLDGIFNLLIQLFRFATYPSERVDNAALRQVKLFVEAEVAIALRSGHTRKMDFHLVPID